MIVEILLIAFQKLDICEGYHRNGHSEVWLFGVTKVCPPECDFAVH